MVNGPGIISVSNLYIQSANKHNVQNNFHWNPYIPAYYVIGGGVRAAIMMDNVAALNGIVHYIDRVLGVPYQTLYEIMRNDSRLQ